MELDVDKVCKVFLFFESIGCSFEIILSNKTWSNVLLRWSRERGNVNVRPSSAYCRYFRSCLATQEALLDENITENQWQIFSRVLDDSVLPKPCWIAERSLCSVLCDAASEFLHDIPNLDDHAGRCIDNDMTTDESLKANIIVTGHCWLPWKCSKHQLTWG